MAASAHFNHIAAVFEDGILAGPAAAIAAVATTGSGVGTATITTNPLA
jgi:hypothetical protein